MGSYVRRPWWRWSNSALAWPVAELAVAGGLRLSHDQRWRRGGLFAYLPVPHILNMISTMFKGVFVGARPLSPQVQSDNDSSQRSTYIKLLILWTMWSLLYAWHGAYVSTSLLWGIAIFVVIGALVIHKPTMRGSWSAMLAVYVVMIASSWLMFFVPGPHWPFALAFPVPLAALVIGFSSKSRLRAVGWCAIVVLEGICIVSAWHWGKVHIDVFSITQQGALDFLRGANPYQSWFQSTTVGVARFRYDYGPLWLLVTTPFARLGDVRVLIGLSSVGILALGAWRYGWRRYATWMWLALLLLSPWLVWGTLMSWTELTMMALLLAWYATRQRWRFAWLFLAVALGANPVIGVLLLPMFAIMPEVRRQVLYAGLVAGACWLCAWGFSGADFIQAFKIAGGQGYTPTIGFGGLYLLLTHHALPKIVTVAVALVVSYWLWRYRASSIWRRELLAGVGCLLIVWAMPAGYFEYALIPALWLWWTLGQATVLVAAPEAKASSA